MGKRSGKKIGFAVGVVTFILSVGFWLGVLYLASKAQRGGLEPIGFIRSQVPMSYMPPYTPPEKIDELKQEVLSLPVLPLVKGQTTSLPDVQLAPLPPDEVRREGVGCGLTSGNLMTELSFAREWCYEAFGATDWAACEDGNHWWYTPSLDIGTCPRYCNCDTPACPPASCPSYIPVRGNCVIHNIGDYPGEFYGFFQWLADQVERILAEQDIREMISDGICGQGSCERTVMDYDVYTVSGYLCGVTNEPAADDDPWCDDPAAGGDGCCGGDLDFGCYHGTGSPKDFPDKWVFYYNRAFIEVFPDPTRNQLVAIIVLWAEGDLPPEANDVQNIPPIDWVDNLGGAAPTSELCAEATICLNVDVSVALVTKFSIQGFIGAALYTNALAIRVIFDVVQADSLVDICVGEIETDFLGSYVDLEGTFSTPIGNCDANDFEDYAQTLLPEDTLEEMISTSLMGPIHENLHGNCDWAYSLCPALPDIMSPIYDAWCLDRFDGSVDGNRQCCDYVAGSIECNCSYPQPPPTDCAVGVFPIDLNEVLGDNAYVVSDRDDSDGKVYIGPYCAVGYCPNPNEDLAEYGTCAWGAGPEATYQYGCYSPYDPTMMGTGCAGSLSAGIAPLQIFVAENCVNPNMPDPTYSGARGFFPRAAFAGQPNYAPVPEPFDEALGAPWYYGWPDPPPGANQGDPDYGRNPTGGDEPALFARRDDGAWPINLVPDVNIYGQTALGACVSTNGYIWLKTSNTPGAQCDTDSAWRPYGYVPPEPRPIPYDDDMDWYVGPLWANLSMLNEYVYEMREIPLQYIDNYYGNDGATVILGSNRRTAWGGGEDACEGGDGFTGPANACTTRNIGFAFPFYPGVGGNPGSFTNVSITDNGILYFPGGCAQGTLEYPTGIIPYTPNENYIAPFWLPQRLHAFCCDDDLSQCGTCLWWIPGTVDTAVAYGQGYVSERTGSQDRLDEWGNVECTNCQYYAVTWVHVAPSCSNTIADNQGCGEAINEDTDCTDGSCYRGCYLRSNCVGGGGVGLTGENCDLECPPANGNPGNGTACDGCCIYQIDCDLCGDNNGDGDCNDSGESWTCYADCSDPDRGCYDRPNYCRFNIYQVVLWEDGVFDINYLLISMEADETQCGSTTWTAVAGFEGPYNWGRGLRIRSGTTYRFEPYGWTGQGELYVAYNLNCPFWTDDNPWVPPDPPPETRNCTVITWRNFHVRGTPRMIDMQAWLLNDSSTGSANHDIVFRYRTVDVTGQWRRIAGVEEPDPPDVGAYTFVGDGQAVRLRWEAPWVYWIGIGISQDVMSDAANLFYTSGMMCLGAGDLTDTRYTDVTAALGFTLGMEEVVMMVPSATYYCDPDGEAEIRLRPWGIPGDVDGDGLTSESPQECVGQAVGPTVRTGAIEETPTSVTYWPTPGFENWTIDGLSPSDQPDFIFFLPAYRSEIWCDKNDIAEYRKNGIVGGPRSSISVVDANIYFAADLIYGPGVLGRQIPAFCDPNTGECLQVFLDVNPQICSAYSPTNVDGVPGAGLPVVELVQGAMADVIADLINGHLGLFIQTKVDIPIDIEAPLHVFMRYIAHGGPDRYDIAEPIWGENITPDYFTIYMGCYQNDCYNKSILGTIDIMGLLQEGMLFSPPQAPFIEEPQARSFIALEDGRFCKDCELSAQETREAGIKRIGTKFRVRIEGGAKAITWRFGNGPWRRPAAVEVDTTYVEIPKRFLLSGKGSFEVVVQDMFGRWEEEPARIRFFIDEDPPDIYDIKGGITTETGIRVFPEENPVIDVYVSDNFTPEYEILISWSVDGKPFTEWTSSKYIVLEGLKKRSMHTLLVIAKDEAGNISESRKLIFWLEGEKVQGCTSITGMSAKEIFERSLGASFLFIPIIYALVIRRRLNGRNGS